MTITVHNYRARQFHKTSNGENPSSGSRDMGATSSGSRAPARPPGPWRQYSSSPEGWGVKSPGAQPFARASDGHRTNMASRAVFTIFVRCPSEEGLPYIPRVHLSEGSLVRSPLKWLWSEEPMVRRSFIPKFLCSESCYVPKIPYSERPSTIWILCYEDSLVRSSSSPKGAMFRTSIFRKSPLPHMVSILRRSFSPKFPQF